jgi:hypothetical protein
MTTRTLRSFVLAACSLALTTANGLSQTCGQQFLPGTSLPGLGTSGGVQALSFWDPDGAGPLEETLVVGGSFVSVGNQTQRSLALWNGQRWSALGPTFNDTGVRCILPLPDNRLLVAGSFSGIGGANFDRIALWNGGTWETVGAGFGPSGFLGSEVRTVIRLANGDLVAGGDFTTADGLAAANVARWNGTEWNPMGAGLPDVIDVSTSGVQALLQLPNGDILAGGRFLPAFGGQTYSLARWNGTTWTPLASDVNNTVNALALLPNGDVLVGGDFNMAGTLEVRGIARLSGTTWSALGDGVFSGSGSSAGRVRSILVRNANDVLVIGSFNRAGTVPASNIARWDGTAWSSVGDGAIGNPPGPGVGGFSRLAAISARTGDIYVTAEGQAGQRVDVGGLTLLRGGLSGTYSTLGEGLTQGQARGLGRAANGDVLMVGDFRIVGGRTVNGVARWNGREWSGIGGGVGPSPQAFAIAELTTGNVVVGGTFTTAGTTTVNNIARWDGSIYRPLSTGTNGQVRALLPQPGGALIAGGSFTTAGPITVNRVSRWSGTAWSAMGSGFSGIVNTLAQLPSGDIIAGGQFTTAGTTTVNNVARWDGSAWQPMATGFNDIVDALTVMPDGTLYAAGRFTGPGSGAGGPFNRLARWTGSAWVAIGGGVTSGSAVSALLALPDGTLLVGGNFTQIGSINAVQLARWNGTNWSGFGLISGPGSGVIGLANAPGGEILAIGGFAATSTQSLAGLARLSLTGAPWCALPPEAVSASAGQTITLRATPATGYSGVRVQWQRNGVNIANGPGGAALGGGTVSGASAARLTLDDGLPSVLTITGTTSADSGSYRAIFSSTCGGTPSAAAMVTITGNACTPSDIAGPNQSIGPDGVLTADDIIVFLGWFFASDSRADIAGPNQTTTPDSNFTADDIIVFLGRFFAGC